jgi:uncharacterized membrane protein
VIELILFGLLLAVWVHVKRLERRLHRLEEERRSSEYPSRLAARGASAAAVPMPAAPVATPMPASGAAGAVAPAAPAARAGVEAAAVAAERSASSAWMQPSPRNSAPVARPVGPEAAPPAKAPADLAEWPLMVLVKQNLFAVAGVGLLLLGFAFLLRSIHWGNLLPPWSRVALAWGFAAALGALGIRLRLRNALWAQIAQGGAAGIAYLAVYVAATRFGMLAGPAAFALFAALAGVLVWRAMAEDSRVLAAVGFIGAYAAPLLGLERGGELAFNLGYGLLVTACALLVSYRKRWLEVAVHAHACAAAVAAVTSHGQLHGLSPEVQQAFLHAYLLQFLGWCVAWSRAGGPARGPREEPLTIACLALTGLCYLGLQDWLLQPGTFGVVATGFATALVALGFLGFDRRPMQEACWLLAALALAAALGNSGLSNTFRDMGLFVEGVFLMLTARSSGSLRAWLARIFVVAGAAAMLLSSTAWPMWCVLAASTALALHFSAFETWGDALGLDAQDGWLQTAIACLCLPALRGAVDLPDAIGTAAWPALAMLLGAAGVLARAGGRGRLPAPVVFGVVAFLAWMTLAVQPARGQASLHLAVLALALGAAVIAARWRLPSDRGGADLAAGGGTMLVLLFPALTTYKFGAADFLVLAVAGLAGVAHVALNRAGLLVRFWRLGDGTKMHRAVPPMAHGLAAWSVLLLVSLVSSEASPVILGAGLAAYLAGWWTWARSGEGIARNVRDVLACAAAVIGLHAWAMAFAVAPDRALHETLSSHLLPVVLAAVGVAFLFVSARRGRRDAWQAAAVLCGVAMAKLLLSLGGVLFSPLGIAGSLLGMGALFLLAGYLAPLPPSAQEEGA